jgi:predicted unusual protein kinase regulating ubiquinone biosynthesis (AarF/ABC1/UbiB family)
MMGRIRSDVQEKLLETFFGVARKDADQVVRSLVDLGALVPTGDLSAVRRSIQYMLDNFMDQPFEAQSIEAISDDLYEIVYDQPFRFPATFTFVMRAFSTLEGVGKGLDPGFNFMEVAKPFAMEIMTNGPSANPSGFLDELSRQAVQVGSSALGLPRRIEDTLEKLEQGDIRVRVRSSENERLLRRLSMSQMGTSYAVLAGSAGVAASVLATQGWLPLAILVGLGAGAAIAAFVRILVRLNRLEQM